MQIHQWELSCSMQTDGRTSRHEGANICFSQFCESALKKVPALLKVSRLSEFCRQKLVPRVWIFFWQSTDVITKDTKTQAEASYG